MKSSQTLVVLSFPNVSFVFEKLKDWKTVALEVSSPFSSGNAFEEKTSVLKKKTKKTNPLA